MKAVSVVPMGVSPRVARIVKPQHKEVPVEEDPQTRQLKKSGDVDDTQETAMSPRVRRRLSNAQESASIFSMVCEQGEVVQWMTACHPDLTAFGLELERRGYRLLSNIAFLTEEDVAFVTDKELRQVLLSTLSRLRHELYRM